MEILYFVLLLGIIVTVHELGHFLVAKMFGVYCSEFSIGMGPKLISWQGKETKYSIRLLPIGGFVQMAGDAENALEGACDIDVPYERTLKGVSHLKQIAIMGAGIVMNFILAFVLFTGIYASVGTYQTVDLPQIGQVIENSPAEQAGFQSEDIILSVQYENELFYPSSFSDLTEFNSGREQLDRIYVVQRNGEEVTLKVTPAYFEEQNAYLIGINALQKHVKYGLGEASMMSIKAMVESSTLIFEGLTDLLGGNNLDQLSGPIGIYTITAEQASLGLANYIWLIAMLSLNVGILNALPLPILDGGRIILSLIEMIRGKPISKKIEMGLMWIGLVAMLALMVVATWQDIARILF